MEDKDAVLDFVSSSHKGKLSVALDVDQVMARPFERVIERLNEKYGTAYTIDDLKDYPTPGKPFLNVPLDEFNKIYDSVWNDEWQRIERIGDIGTLLKLSAKFKVDIVSSRGEEAAAPLRKWIAQYYPEMTNQIVVVKKYSDKSTLPYDIFIDDAPRLAETLREMDGKLLMLIDAPYNVNIPNSNSVVHFTDVNAASRHLLDCVERKRKD